MSIVITTLLFYHSHSSTPSTLISGCKRQAYNRSSIAQHVPQSSVTETIISPRMRETSSLVAQSLMMSTEFEENRLVKTSTMDPSLKLENRN